MLVLPALLLSCLQEDAAREAIAGPAWLESKVLKLLLVLPDSGLLVEVKEVLAVAAPWRGVAPAALEAAT